MQVERGVMTVKNLEDLLQESIIKHGDSLALWSQDQRLTYSELAEQVVKYRAHLLSAGVQSGDRIAVLLPRDSHLLIAILGIFSVGAVYVPLYAHNPVARNEILLDDSQCLYLIATEAYLQQRNDWFAASEQADGAYTTGLQSWPFSTAAGFTKSLLIKTAIIDGRSFESTQVDLAYIIYTSGSTGKPKGVMVSHANVLSMIHWALTLFDKEVLRYTLASTAICFDLSIFEMFVPLVAGGCVVLVDTALTLIDQCPPLPISLINTVPSAIRGLLTHAAIPPSVQTINLAGEALEQSLVDALHDSTAVKQVYNLYGPSETTTYSTYYLAKPAVQRIMVPIGAPILGTTLYLLDKQQLPVPFLARGELYIAGPGVTLGYCNRSEETKSRYLTLELGEKTVLVYRTGDLARLNHENEYEYLGRIDQQIKIHGYRIEIDEIVNTLQLHPQIKQAYVKVSALNQEDTLACYLVLNSDGGWVVDDLRQWLQQRLPDYMIPQYFVVLDAFPLNSNGKIDRAALPNPVSQAQLSDSNDHAYQNELEVEIADLWRSILPNAQLDRQSNFFYHGGHSLLAVRLLAKLKSRYAIDCHLEALFRYSTIAAQATLVKQRLQEGTLSAEWTVAARGEKIPLSYGQERLWYLQYAEKNRPISNIPIVISIRGQLDIEALEAAWQTIVKRHEILRTVYRMENYQISQQVRDDFTLQIHREFIESAEELEPKLILEANKPFDLGVDLMIRMALFILAPSHSVLMLTQHHIASDAWSLNILMKELSLLYKAYHHQTELPQLPIPTQYAEYSCWQRSAIYEQKFEDELVYWKEKLAGAPQTIALPYDRKPGNVATYHGAFYQWEIAPALLKKLKSVAHENNSTLFMVLLAGFDVLLYRYAQQEDFCVGILSANRLVQEVHHTLGFFVNSLVTRHQVQPSLSVKALLMQVRETVLSSLEHQQLPFDKLVEALLPERQINRHPFFQVLFSLQNALDTHLTLEALSLDVSEFDRKIAKFDLTVSLVEQADKLVGIMEYNTDWFESSTIEQMTQHFILILTALT